MLDGSLRPVETDALDFFETIERTKFLAIVSCTILVYDMFLTLPEEVYYVWGSRWSFARFAFHANRVWAPVLLAGYVPTLFTYGLREEICIAISLFYTYGTVLAAIIVGIVLVVRIWAIYGRKRWILITALSACFAVSIPTLVLLQLRAREKKFIENPAPRLISGCTLKTSPLGAGAYVGPFVYETGIFLLTVYKTWKISNTPLIQRLMRDGSKYYLVVIATLLLIVGSSFDPEIRRAMTGSGILTAVVATMCTRLILSGLSFYDENQGGINYMEISLNGRQSVDSGIPGSEWF